MKFEAHTINEYYMIKMLDVRIESDDIAQFKEIFLAYYKLGIAKIVIDLKEVIYMDIELLKFLGSLTKTLEEKKGVLYCLHVHGFLFDMVQLLKIDAFLNLVDEVEGL